MAVEVIIMLMVFLLMNKSELTAHCLSSGSDPKEATEEALKRWELPTIFLLQLFSKV